MSMYCRKKQRKNMQTLHVKTPDHHQYYDPKLDAPLITRQKFSVPYEDSYLSHEMLAGNNRSSSRSHNLCAHRAPLVKVLCGPLKQTEQLSVVALEAEDS
ncbi:unnamed protein product [Pleuronectes platessa]|uniref:Uncharacterized protein n=1 Tax=Pleuronectes platessa TaxID=8262 RepID=A0A9N7UYT3_PLEPL|nr:unnamed protein product [Pleuronectes platessa]